MYSRVILHVNIAIVLATSMAAEVIAKVTQPSTAILAVISFSA